MAPDLLFQNRLCSIASCMLASTFMKICVESSSMKNTSVNNYYFIYYKFDEDVIVIVKCKQCANIITFQFLLDVKLDGAKFRKQHTPPKNKEKNKNCCKS